MLQFNTYRRLGQPCLQLGWCLTFDSVLLSKNYRWNRNSNKWCSAYLGFQGLHSSAGEARHTSFSKEICVSYTGISAKQLQNYGITYHQNCITVEVFVLYYRMCFLCVYWESTLSTSLGPWKSLCPWFGLSYPTKFAVGYVIKCSASAQQHRACCISLLLTYIYSYFFTVTASKRSTNMLVLPFYQAITTVG